jgi:hypothetical protein
VRRWFQAWQCSPAENCVVLPQGFKIFALFDFVSGVNLKNKHSYSASDAMLMDNPILPAGVDRGFNLRLHAKTCAQNIVAMKTSKKERSSFLEEVKKIENRVAWFLAELCKGEKGLQKDKRNQRRTELVRGV